MSNPLSFICLLRSMCISSIPTRVDCVTSNDLKPSIGQVTRCTPRTILLDNIIEILCLTEHNVRAVLLVVALDGGCIGLTAIDGHLLRHAMAADRFLQKPERRFFSPVLREQTVDRVAMFVHSGARRDFGWYGLCRTARVW
jgi:hypothetical protein